MLGLRVRHWVDVVNRSHTIVREQLVVSHGFVLPSQFSRSRINMGESPQLGSLI